MQRAGTPNKDRRTPWAPVCALSKVARRLIGTHWNPGLDPGVRRRRFTRACTGAVFELNDR